MRSDNRMDSIDTAAYEDRIPWLTPEGTVTTNAAYAWTEGRIYIANPFGWNVSGTTGDEFPYKRFGENTVDTIMLDANGRVGVWKLDNWVERKTNNVVNLHGPRAKLR